MENQKYKKVTFQFPAEEYVYLKMAYAKQGASIKDFLTKSAFKSIAEYEDELDLISYRKAKEENGASIPWEEAEKKLGWDKL